LYCFDTLGLPSTASTILLKIVIQPAYLDLKEYDFLAVSARISNRRTDRWIDGQTDRQADG
jgi:hypothetical protein